MKVCVYSVRDLINGYGQPFTSSNDAAATRDFKLALSRKDSLLYVSCEDFDLMRIGEFDDETGMLEPCAPTIIAKGYVLAKEFENA